MFVWNSAGNLMKVLRSLSQTYCEQIMQESAAGEAFKSHRPFLKLILKRILKLPPF
jgi:hypothetical protein